MKKDQIQIGTVYAVKVGGAIRPVRIESVSQYGGWNAINLTTNRAVRIRSAQKCRAELQRNPATGKWKVAKKEELTEKEHSGAVCYDCGRTVTESEYSYGETKCCKAGVVPEEEYGKIDGFTN